MKELNKIIEVDIDTSRTRYINIRTVVSTNYPRSRQPNGIVDEESTVETMLHASLASILHFENAHPELKGKKIAYFIDRLAEMYADAGNTPAVVDVISDRKFKTTSENGVISNMNLAGDPDSISPIKSSKNHDFTGGELLKIKGGTYYSDDIGRTLFVPDKTACTFGRGNELTNHCTVCVYLEGRHIEIQTDAINLDRN